MDINKFRGSFVKTLDLYFSSRKQYLCVFPVKEDVCIGNILVSCILIFIVMALV